MGRLWRPRRWSGPSRSSWRSTMPSRSAKPPGLRWSTTNIRRRFPSRASSTAARKFPAICVRANSYPAAGTRFNSTIFPGTRVRPQRAPSRSPTGSARLEARAFGNFGRPRSILERLNPLEEVEDHLVGELNRLREHVDSLADRKGRRKPMSCFIRFRLCAGPRVKSTPCAQKRRNVGSSG